MLNVVMAKGRRLKKCGGDLKAHKKNVVSSKLTITKQNVDPLQVELREQNVARLELRHGKQNVVPSKLKIDESSNLCGLELAMVTICNSNGEITLNIDREFRSKMVGWIILEFTYIKLNADEKKCTIFLKFNYICTFHHLMENARFFLSNFFYCNT
jgi:hypothetical protein